jgi:hypothetical protein
MLCHFLAHVSISCTSSYSKSYITFIEDDEEAVLIAMHEHSGNKWTLISKQLPGRSDNDVKVRRFALTNRLGVKSAH